MTALVNWALGDYGYVDYYAMKSAASTQATMYFIMFAFLIGLTSINLFVAIFVDWWEERKNQKVKEDADMERLRAEGLLNADVSLAAAMRSVWTKVKPEFGLQLYRDADDFAIFDIAPLVKKLRKKCAEYKGRPLRNKERPPRLYICISRHWKCVDDALGSYTEKWVNGYSDKMFSPPLDPPNGTIDWKDQGADGADGEHDPTRPCSPSNMDPTASNRHDLFLTLLDQDTVHNETAEELFKRLGWARSGKGADLVLGATDSSFASSTTLVKLRGEGIFTHTMVVKELGLDLDGKRFYRDRHYSVRDTFVEFALEDADTKSMHQSSIFFRASRIGLVQSDPTKVRQCCSLLTQGLRPHVLLTCTSFFGAGAEIGGEGSRGDELAERIRWGKGQRWLCQGWALESRGCRTEAGDADPRGGDGCDEERLPRAVHDAVQGPDHGRALTGGHPVSGPQHTGGVGARLVDVHVVRAVSNGDQPAAQDRPAAVLPQQAAVEASDRWGRA